MKILLALWTVLFSIVSQSEIDNTHTHTLIHRTIKGKGVEGISYKMLSDRCCSEHACRGVTGSPAGLAAASEPPARAAWCQGVTDRAPRLQSEGFISSRNYYFTRILSSARLKTSQSSYGKRVIFHTRSEKGD